MLWSTYFSSRTQHVFTLKRKLSVLFCPYHLTSLLFSNCPFLLLFHNFDVEVKLCLRWCGQKNVEYGEGEESRSLCYCLFWSYKICCEENLYLCCCVRERHNIYLCIWKVTSLNNYQRIPQFWSLSQNKRWSLLWLTNTSTFLLVAARTLISSNTNNNKCISYRSQQQVTWQAINLQGYNFFPKQ